MIHRNIEKYFFGVSYLGFVLLISCSPKVEWVQDAETGLFLPSDLEATLWAESPLLYNPTNMDVDYRGRIWVTEAVNYRNYNNDSTHNLYHSEGDRVMILEDRDQDGKADTAIVFVQDKDLRSPLGIAVIGNQVIVSCAPNLIVYTDENGDDKPDKKEILLTGFGGYDHDHSLHSVVAGPDGKWYFNVGNAGPHHVRDKAGWTLRSGSVYTGGSPYNTNNQGGQQSDDGKVWVGGMQLCVNPDGTGLKVLAHGFRNSYETYIDSYGDLWQNDNDDQVVACRASWLMEGANMGYFSEDGTRYWFADQRPGQDMFTAHWHQEDPGVLPAGDNTGAGSPTGVLVNESDKLGKRYLGMFMSADAGRNIIFGYKPQNQGAGFDLGARENLIRSVAEDDEGYFWNDSTHSHRLANWFRPSDLLIGTDGALYISDWYDPVVGGHLMRDSSGYGRIYRISPKGKKLKTPTINLNSLSGQIEAMKSAAPNVRASAMKHILTKEDATQKTIRALQASSNPYHRARAVFLQAAWSRNHAKDQIVSLKELHAKSKQKGNHRLMVAAFRAILPLATKAESLALCRELAQAKEPMLRREVALVLRDLPFDEKKDIIQILLGEYNGSDPWELESIAQAIGSDADKMLGQVQKLTLPIQRKLAWRLHTPAYLPTLKNWVLDPKADSLGHRQALTGIAFIRDTSAAALMLDLGKHGDAAIQHDARYWLAFRRYNDWAGMLSWEESGIDLEHERKVAERKAQCVKLQNKLIADWDRMSTAEWLAKDSLGGMLLMDLVAGGKLEGKILSVVAKTIFQNPNPAVKVRASAHFKNEVVWSLEAMLDMKSDKTKGQSLFEKSCATCHRLNGKGANIGPDLSQIHEKYDQRALLEAIVLPSNGIVFGYEGWLIQTQDGNTTFGFIEADGAMVQLRDLSGSRRTIPAASIASRTRQETSLMPEPRALGLSEQDVVDIVGYLKGKNLITYGISSTSIE